MGNHIANAPKNKLLPVCVDCGAIAFKQHTDKLFYCYRCLDTGRDEEYQRQIDRENE